jgi:cytochrome o ubiquinol oxidase operon protein cyoD
MMKSRVLKTYISGFVLSLGLTLAAYFVVTSTAVPRSLVVWVIMIAAVFQFIVQTIFFLHLDEERRPRWNLAIFVSTLGIVLVVIVGSLWIMANLNYQHTSPADIIKDEGIQL